MTTQHRTVVGYRTSGYRHRAFRARCTCGWQAPSEWTWRNYAVVDAADHTRNPTEES